MKAELTLSPEEIDAIASRVAEKLKPLLSASSKESGDVIYDVAGLADYLKVTPKWIHARTHLKEITHYKLGGQLRFRKKDIDRWAETQKVLALNQPFPLKLIK
jgi:excisionase family DNA binding protein